MDINSLFGRYTSRKVALIITCLYLLKEVVIPLGDWFLISLWMVITGILGLAFIIFEGWADKREREIITASEAADLGTE